MTTFTPYEGKYTNHIGITRHPVNSTIYHLVTFHPGGSGPFNLQIWQHAPPYTGAPVLIRQWVQGSADAPGPFGYGDLECLPDGSIYIGVAAGALNASDIQPAYRVEPNCCAPFAAGGVPGPKGDKGDKGDTGATGPQGVPGPAGSGSGGLTPSDRSALDRLKAWLGIA